MAKSIQFKAEKGRVLVPVGAPCRFACKYCYTRGGEVGPARVSSEEILQQFRLFAKDASFETIQFGYDGDPFDYPERGIIMLQQLATMGKNIGFSTKALVEGQTLRSLAEIQHVMAEFKTTLSALVSLSCWDSAEHIEPHTPTPAQRMMTLTNFKSINILTFIAVRPILPNIDDSEYERLADEGIKAGSDGFILGPLYADDKGLFVRFIPPEVLKKVPGVRGVVPWSAHSPVWTRYEDEARLHRLSEMIEKKGGRVFLSSADAVDFAHNKLSLIGGSSLIEVELKFALSVSSLPALQEKLRTMRSTGSVQNTDVYYDTPSFDFIQQAVFVRIRNSNQLQFKIDASAELTHVQSMERTFSLVPEPRQAATMNALFARFFPAWQPASTVEAALHNNGLIELAYIENTRKEYVQDDITLSIDHVKGLGDFLEIETRCEEDTDTRDALARLHSFVSGFDLQPVHVGYVELWLRIHNPEAYRLGKYHV